MTVDVDVVVVGGGPAGLSAALILGRCRRRVVVCDSGQYRNAATPAMHGFLTRDGCDPAEVRRIGRAQLQRYPSVSIRDAPVVDAARCDGGFTVGLAGGDVMRTRLLLLATGVVDDLPAVAGAEELLGRGVFHCPYCDGFEVAGRPLVAYGRGQDGLGMALELRGWSDQVVLCTDGPAELSPHERDRLTANGISLEERRVARVEGGDRLQAVVFADGSAYDCAALFFLTGQRQRSDLAARLGCEFTDDGSVATGEYETTCVPGLYVAGDASRRVQLAIVAAAEGAKAAFAMNTALLRTDLA